MTDDMKPEMGDTVIFTARGEYGLIKDVEGVVDTVFKNGKVKINSRHGIFTLAADQVFVLSRAG